MEAVDLATIVGSIAAVLALWTGLLEVVRWVRRRRARSSLEQELLRLFDLDRQLSETVAELDYRLSEGTGWAGWAIWPDKLAPSLYRLWHAASELDRMRARVRAQWAEGPIERLRDDIEQLVSSLRRATGIYASGAVARYRSSGGEPIGRSATGRGPAVVIPDESDREAVDELRSTARLLFRSSAYQLGLKDMAEQEDVALWPLWEREAWALQRHYFRKPPDAANDPP